MDTAALEDKVLKRLESLPAGFWAEKPLEELEARGHLGKGTRGGYETQLGPFTFILNAESREPSYIYYTLDCARAGEVETIRLFNEGWGGRAALLYNRLNTLFAPKHEKEGKERLAMERENEKKRLDLLQELAQIIDEPTGEKERCQCAEEGYIAGGPPFPCL